MKTIIAGSRTASIKDVIDLYNKGELAEINASNVNSHFGTNKNITNPN